MLLAGGDQREGDDDLDQRVDDQHPAAAAQRREQARGASRAASRIAAAIATRTQARNAGGTPSSTATLMKKYGMPQRTETEPKANQARALTRPSL